MARSLIPAIHRQILQVGITLSAINMKKLLLTVLLLSATESAIASNIVMWQALERTQGKATYYDDKFDNHWDDIYAIKR